MLRLVRDHHTEEWSYTVVHLNAIDDPHWGIIFGALGMQIAGTWVCSYQMPRPTSPELAVQVLYLLPNRAHVTFAGWQQSV
jgi:hypothetical protein